MSLPDNGPGSKRQSDVQKADDDKRSLGMQFHIYLDGQMASKAAIPGYAETSWPLKT